MKVYLAGPWAAREEVRKVAEQFKAAGIEILARWIWEEVPDHGPGYYGDKDHRGTDVGASLVAGAERDLTDILHCDVMVVLNYLGKSEGKAVETGIAIGLGMPVFVVGKPTNIFHYGENDGVNMVDSVEEAIERLIPYQG